MFNTIETGQKQLQCHPGKDGKLDDSKVMWVEKYGHPQ
jgi:hypothetical protein